MMAAGLFGNGVQRIAQGTILWSADTVRLALLTSAYVPDLGNHAFFSSVSSFEIDEPGYGAGGLLVTGKSTSYDSSSLSTSLVANDVVWNDVSFTASYAILYKEDGGGSTSPLIAVIGDGGNWVSNESEFRISWPSGALRLVPLP